MVAAPAGPAVRQHVRVPCRDVTAGVRIEGTDDWVGVGVGDLSLGGALLETDRYIVEGTIVDVGFAFPSGARVLLNAEVVRALEASARGPAAIGVRFTRPSSDALGVIQAELAPRMQQAASAAPQAPAAHALPAPAPRSSPSRGTSGTSGATELAGTVYERLRLRPDCDDGQLRAGLAALLRSLDDQLASTPPGAQREQVAIFKQTIERLRPLGDDPIKRAAYDFKHGLVRADERIALARAGRGPSLEQLQAAWARIFVVEVREAKRLFVEVRHGGEGASTALARALELDPFNSTLRAVDAQQRSLASAPAGHVDDHPPAVVGAALPPSAPAGDGFFSALDDD